MPCDLGDVLLVPFPFTDQSASKKRPAVVVSNRAYNQARQDVILMAITSQGRAGAFGELFLTHWQAAGLIKPSTVKPAITTLDQRLILKTLGRLRDDDLARLRELLPQLIG